jgi:hypothetical protein
LINILRTSIALCLLTTALHTECTAAQALRYLKSAGSTAWQGTKRTAHWAVKNPYKIASGALAVDAVYKLHNEHTTCDKVFTLAIAKAQRGAAAIRDPKLQKIMNFVTEECQHHGFKTPLFFLTNGPDYEVMCSRHNDQVFLQISKKALTLILMHEQGIPTSMGYWKEILLHELGHAKEYHSKSKIASGVTLGSQNFKRDVATGIALATSVSATTKGIVLLSKCSLSAPSRAIALRSILTYGPPLVGACSYFITKKITDHTFPAAANAWTRKREREADAYVAETAFERKDPTILDRFAQHHQNRHDQGFISADSHPQCLERAQTARAAAAKLRALMENEEVEDTLITTHCSPF